MRRTLLVMAAFVMAAPGCAETTTTGDETPAPEVETPMTEEDKLFYAMGVAIARSLEQYELTEDEGRLVQSGIAAAMSGEETEINLDEWNQKFGELGRSRMQAAAEREKSAAAEFVDEMAAKQGARQFESGLVMFELAPGEGASPGETDTVKVHYHGTLRDGTVFDSSVERGEPATFPLNRVIKCWTEGVQKMKVGGKSRLICPSAIAYGDRGSPPRIQPGAALVFEVELLEIQ